MMIFWPSELAEEPERSSREARVEIGDCPQFVRLAWV